MEQVLSLILKTEQKLTPFIVFHSKHSWDRPILFKTYVAIIFYYICLPLLGASQMAANPMIIFRYIYIVVFFFVISMCSYSEKLLTLTFPWMLCCVAAIKIILSAFVWVAVGSVDLVWQMANNWFWSQLTVRTAPLRHLPAFFFPFFVFLASKLG